MTGTTLKTFITGLNGGASIDDVLMATLIGVAKTIFQSERDWMRLRKTDTSISFSSGSTWQTSYSLANITDFSRFYGNFPIRIFDGNNRVEYYKQVPWSERLQYKNINNTFVFDEGDNKIYFNGTNSISGTVYLNFIKSTIAVDVLSTVELDVIGSFPFHSDYHPILGFYVIGISKGAIDYDEINRGMLPSNQAALVALKSAAEKQDTQKQLTEVEQTDPYNPVGSGFRADHIGINNIF